MHEMTNENLTQGAVEVAKHSSFSFSLDGWPAATTLMTISLLAAGVIVYAMSRSPRP